LKIKRAGGLQPEVLCKAMWAASWRIRQARLKLSSAKYKHPKIYRSPGGAVAFTGLLDEFPNGKSIDLFIDLQYSFAE
jgi:hypothetical protein